MNSTFYYDQKEALSTVNNNVIKKYLLKKKKIPDYGTDMQTWEYRT